MEKSSRSIFLQAKEEYLRQNKTANQYENVPWISLKNKAMSIPSREKDQNIGWKHDEGGEKIAAV